MENQIHREKGSVSNMIRGSVSHSISMLNNMYTENLVNGKRKPTAQFHPLH